MNLVPYKFVPKYSLEEINSSHIVLAETTAQPSSFSIRRNIIFQSINNPSKILP
jgi:hypothetical protein